MKTLTVRLPETLVAEIETESRERRRSKSDIVRERLSASSKKPPQGALPDIIADVVGIVDDLPPDMSERVKYYLKIKGYGRKRPR
jgi:Ribbon-helix-helix protein, copG family